MKASNFVLVPLADLGNWVGGGTPSKANPSFWENGTIPWVSPKDMKTDHIRAAEDYITELAVKESTTNQVPAGSILVVTRSGILRHTLPVAIADVPVTINQDLKALALKPDIDPKYVAFALRTFSREILNQCSKQGTTVNSIETQKLLRFQIPLTSYPQQTRIVAEIEKQFSRLDEAVANLKRVKANLKRYKAAVLKAAVEGKLTEEWRKQHPDVEPADKLLERILVERRKGAGKGKYKEPVGPDTSGLPELPAGWVWVRLDAIAALKGGITVDKKRKDPTARPVPYLRVANVQRGYLDLSEIKEIDASSSDIEDLRLQPGDILFNEGGDRDKLGRGWIWEGQIPECIHQNHVFRARLYLSGVAAKLISWWGNTFGKQYFLNAGKQTTNLASINLTKLSEFPVPLPPLAEQSEIVTEVERRLSIIGEAEAEVDVNLRRADRLRQSILKQAFSGQLVPQGPNDEPASVLLERIRNGVGAIHESPVLQSSRKGRPRKNAVNSTIRELPLQKTKPTPAASNEFTSLDSVLAAILNRMQLGREYSHAEIADPLGLSTGRWNAAIQELKRRGQVRQVGERRGARYIL